MPKPQFSPVPQVRYQIEGYLRGYLDGAIAQWLLVAPLSNPAMLEMLRDRDCPPLRDMVPWAGEFAGKYLTAAVEMLRLSGDGRLRAWIQQFVHRLVSFQDSDGYLGPCPRAFRLTNTRSDGKSTWDTWGHYHVMLGLLLWYEEAGDVRALSAAMRIADLVCSTYAGNRENRLVDTPDTDKNLAPIHSLCILHRLTGERRYLDMAAQIAEEFAAEREGKPLAGDYLRQALAGREFHQMPKPRWESLHAIMGLAELYWATGHDDYRRSFEHLWWSMVGLERHNNGGFSSGEQATGNPYDLRPIETCCTVAWIALSVEMLKMTGGSVVADEIELSTLNSIVGAHSPTGRWATYSTPMNGIRRASAHSIVFQAREGSPELNCCSANSPRGFGLISDWALMRGTSGLVLNWYGPSTMLAPVTAIDDGGRALSVTLTQETEYPLSGHVRIRVNPGEQATFGLSLRIPYWSSRTEAALNGVSVGGACAGTYLPLGREWRPGDVVDLWLDMSPHMWAGERECANLTSIYRGPLLLAYDHRYNLDRCSRALAIRNYDESQPRLHHGLRIPALDAQRLELRPVEWEDWMSPILLLRATAMDGANVHLCDFASAGVSGTPYASWLPVLNGPAPVPFSRQNPLRSAHLKNSAPQTGSVASTTPQEPGHGPGL